jgi:hypothetical protein
VINNLPQRKIVNNAQEYRKNLETIQESAPQPR